MFNKKLALLFVVIALSGCSTTYYGHTESEWASLSEAERIAAIENFEKLEREQYLLIHGDSRDNATKAFTERALGTH